MNSPHGKPAESAHYWNRSSDRVSSATLVENEADMLVLLEAYRLKEISADSVSGSIDLRILFGWLTKNVITQKEFDELMGAQEVQEIVLGKDAGADPLSDEPSETEKIAEMREKTSAFPERTASENFTMGHVNEWSAASENGCHQGIWAVFRFEKKEKDDEGPAVSFTVELRTLQSPREGIDAVKAELVFSGYDRFGAESYFVATVPLPVVREGRRKLFMTFSEAGTKSPLRLPPDVAMAFREKFLVKLEILHEKPKSKGFIDLVSKAVGRVIGK